MRWWWMMDDDRWMMDAKGRRGGMEGMGMSVCEDPRSRV